MKQVFIVQTFGDKSDDVLNNEFAYLRSVARDLLEPKMDDGEALFTMKRVSLKFGHWVEKLTDHEDDPSGLLTLIENLKIANESDLIIFGNGWKDLGETKMLHTICRGYGKRIIYP